MHVYLEGACTGEEPLMLPLGSSYRGPSACLRDNGPCFPEKPICGCLSFVLCSSKCLLHTEARVSLWNFIQTSLLCLQLSTGLAATQGLTLMLWMGHLLASSMFFKRNSHIPVFVCLCGPLCLQDPLPMYSMQLALKGVLGRALICSTPKFSALCSLICSTPKFSALCSLTSPLNTVPPLQSPLFICLNCSVSSRSKSCPLLCFQHLAWDLAHRREWISVRWQSEWG